MSRWMKQRVGPKSWTCPVPTCPHHTSMHSFKSGAALGVHFTRIHAKEWSYDPDTGKATNVAEAVPAVSNLRGVRPGSAAAQEEGVRGFLAGDTKAMEKSRRDFEQRQQQVAAQRDLADMKWMDKAPPATAVQATTAILNLPEVAGMSAAQLQAIMGHVCAIKAIDETGFDSTNLAARVAPGGVNHMGPRIAQQDRELVEA